MELKEIASIIKELPMLIMYVVPGYLFLWSMGLVLSRNIKKDNHLVFKSIAISYILIVVGNWVFENVLASWGTKTLMLVSSLILGWIMAKIILSQWFKKVLIFIGITQSVCDNFLTDIADFNLGLMAIAYLPNEKMIYKGEIRQFEEKESSESSFMVLSNYVQYNYEGIEKLNYEGEDNYRILLNTRDISRIELYYHPDSTKIT